MNPRGGRRRLAWLGAYALAMALVEAAIVVHLRHLYYPDAPRALFPLRLLTAPDLVLELARELATVVMIWAVAVLAERGALRVFAAFVFVFGLWDLGYYLWLEIFLGWPVGWNEWDVLFLIPWPWFGPWIAPALIALLFVAWGGALLLSDRAGPVGWRAPIVFTVGAAVSLVAFLAPGAALLEGGQQAFAGFRPAGFWWGTWLVGWALMAFGLGRMYARGVEGNGV